MLLPGNCLPMRRAAGDCKLKSLSTGRVLETGVIAELGVCGPAGLGLPDCRLEKGVDGAKMLLPPHFAHLAFFPPAPSEDWLLRRPLRFGW